GESQLAIALIDPTHYTADALTLAPGDVVVVVTDGLLEVFDRRDRELGREGLHRDLEQTGPAATLEEIEAALFEVCRRFGAQTDDQTVLVLRTL
ncbi:MAG: SpoIIE family protein phosphatase, partial [Acidobacteria bacterium]|nr:SpoIIE family protein phosphatase [Acidobacteriota bacterium]